MAAFALTPADLAPFAMIDEAKALAMIEDAMAIAAAVAPCILTDDFTKGPAAKAIIRAAVLRWNEVGSGASTNQQAGPFGVGTQTARKGMFWPAEITDLQTLCSTGKGKAFSIDTLARGGIVHADICSLNFGALYCSCGADLTGSFPLWEV